MTLTRSHSLVRLGALTLGTVLALTLGSPAWAQWKWKDKSGHTQYSDLPPPPAIPEQDILQRPAGQNRRAPAPFPGAAASDAAGAASGPKSVEPELEAKRSKAEQEEAAKKKAEADKLAAARLDNCSRAKAQLRSIDDGMRMARVNAKGEREILDDNARAEEAKRTKAIIASDCK
jgi:hypothetical protein